MKLLVAGDWIDIVEPSSTAPEVIRLQDERWRWHALLQRARARRDASLEASRSALHLPVFATDSRRALASGLPVPSPVAAIIHSLLDRLPAGSAAGRTT